MRKKCPPKKCWWAGVMMPMSRNLKCQTYYLIFWGKKIYGNENYVTPLQG